MSRTKKLPAIGAALTSTLTAVDVAYLRAVKTEEVWIFCLVAAIAGTLLTYHLLECAGLLGEGEQ